MRDWKREPVSGMELAVRIIGATAVAFIIGIVLGHIAPTWVTLGGTILTGVVGGIWAAKDIEL